MICFENVSKTVGSGRGAVSILNNVEVTFPAGMCVAIVGGQGSGKSTVLKMISGIDFPTRGKIRTNLDISWVASQVQLENKMTVRQNIRFLGRLAGCSDLDEFEANVRGVIDLGAKYYRSAGSLTRLERRALTVATTLTIDFDVYLFDAFPSFRGLGNQDKLEELFEKRRTDAGILFCGNRQDLANNCDAALLLHNRQLKYYSNVEESLKDFDRIIGEEN